MRLYKRIGEKVKLEVPVLVKAGVRIEEGANPKITAAEIMPLEDAKVPLPRAIRVRIPLESSGEATTPGRRRFPRASSGVGTACRRGRERWRPTAGRRCAA